MIETVEFLMKLVRSEITGESISFPENFSCDFQRLMNLAKKHEISQLVSDALIKNGLITDEDYLKTAREQIFYASYRDSKNEYTLDIAQTALENAQIEYIPLKGSVIKKNYPESWMRTSCDIDILVGEQNFDRAVKALKATGFDVSGSENYHDISLLFDDTNLELHFNICEDIDYIDSLLKNVWNYTKQVTNYQYLQTNDFFVFHHIAHMVYHFLTGGCGVRTFIDLWVLKRCGFFDEKEVCELCRKAGILDFYKAISDVIGVWFEGKQPTQMTDRIEEYVIRGGAYGVFPNNAAAYTVLNGGKTKFLLSLIFPSFANMRVLYPVLNSAPVILPLCYLDRMLKKLLKKESKAVDKLNVIKNQDSEFVEKVGKLMKELKLKK